MESAIFLCAVLIGIILQGDVMNPVLAEDAKCIFEDENSMRKILFRGMSVEVAKDVLRSATCIGYVQSLCSNSSDNYVKEIKELSLCFLQFDETCACGNSIKTQEWTDGLLQCPPKLSKMQQTPKCLRNKLCKSMESNWGQLGSHVEKFGNKSRKELCPDEDKEEILKREKRQAATQKLSCSSFASTQASTYSTAVLSSIDASVFRDCPRSLVSPNYTMDQLVAVAGQAIASLGDPCRWSDEKIQNLSVVILGLNESFLSCIPFTDPSITVIGKSLYSIPSASSKVDQLYNRWKNRTTSPNVTSDIVSLLQGFTCAFKAGDLDSVTLSDFSKSLSVFSQYNCFKYPTFLKLYNLTCTSFGANGQSWNATTIKNVCNVVAGMPQEAFVGLSSVKIAAICPSVFAVLRFEIINALSVNQTSSLTLEQLKAIPQAILANLTTDRRDLIISLLQRFNQTSTTKVITSTVTQTQGNSTTTTTTSSSTITTTTTKGGTGKTTMSTENVATTATTNGAVTLVTSSGTPALDGTSPGESVVPPDVSPVETTVPPGDNSGETGTQPDTNVPADGEGTTQAHQNQGGLTTVQNPNAPGKGQTLSTRAPPNGQVPDNLPDVIDASNIGQFLNNIGSKLSTEDVQRIDPSALASPDVLAGLSNNDLDVSLRLALMQKVNEMLSKTGFNPIIYASGQDFIEPKRYKNLTNNQMELIVRVPSYTPSFNLLPVIGPKVSAILLADHSKMAAFKKVLFMIPSLEFSKLINNQKITQDSLRPFSGSLLSDKQSRDLYKSFLTDSGVDITNMDPTAKVQLLMNLPDCLSRSIRSDDVQGLNPNASFSILKAIDQSIERLHGLNNRNNLDLGSDDHPLPVEYELYDRMANGSQLTEDQKDFLLSNQLLTVKDIKDMGSDVCGVILDNGIFVGSDPTLVSTIFYQCSTELKDHCKSLLTLPVGIMTPDELQGLDAKVAQQLCLMDICPEAAWISDSMTKVIIDVIESIANKRPEILLIPRLTPFLPRLKVSTLQLMNDSVTIRRACQQMACELPGNIPAAALREKMEFCLRNNASLRNLRCTGEDSSLFLSMSTGNFFQSNVTCDEFLSDIDILQAVVIDCKTRRIIYECALRNLNFTDANEVAQMFSLVDQMSEDEFNEIPKSFLCGLLSTMSGLYEKWDAISEGRTSAGFKPLEMCPRGVTYQRLMDVDATADCGGSAAVVTARRKRQTESRVTCSTIYQMSSNVVVLMASELGSLSKEEFMKCLDILGRVEGFNESQWNVLAILAKNAYGSDVSKWTPDIIASSAGIVSGLSAAEISSLVLDRIELVSAIGRNGLWNDEKLSSAFASVKKNLLKDSLTSMTPSQLRSMGEVICGATVIDIASVPAAVICESFQNLGHLEECAANQMAEFLRVIKDPSCLGGSPSSWTPSNIFALGSLIGGLTKDDLSKLSNEQLRFISPSSIPFISPMQFNGFTAEQLQQLSLDQAARITSSQLKSLDANKQKVIQDKLASIKSEIALSLTTDSGSGKRFGSNGPTLLLAFLALALRCA